MLPSEALYDEPSRLRVPFTWPIRQSIGRFDSSTIAWGTKLTLVRRLTKSPLEIAGEVTGVSESYGSHDFLHAKQTIGLTKQLMRSLEAQLLHVPRRRQTHTHTE